MSHIGAVIPASDRQQWPFQAVEAVLSQLAESDELVVVIGPDTNLPSALGDTSVNEKVRVVEDTSPTGPGRARNLGVAALDADVEAILFCDSDDRVTDEWVRELSEPIVEGSADLTGGAYRIRHSTSETAVTPGIDLWYRQSLFGGCLGISLEAWRGLGGFEESLRYCQDTDLAWRAIDRGFEVVVVPTAVVEYSTESMLAEFFQRFNWGKFSVILLKKHGVASENLPSFVEVYLHTKSSGFADSPMVASIGQWAGHRYGQVLEWLQ